MVAISFSLKEEFPEMIRQGTKDQTIRPFNKRRFEQIKRIRKLQLYWKQRTKECYKIADAWATEIFKIRFEQLFWDGKYHICMYNEEKGEYYPVSYDQQREITKRDGLTEIEFFNLFHKKYGDIEEMEFMVIRFIVEGVE